MMLVCARAMAPRVRTARGGAVPARLTIASGRDSEHLDLRSAPCRVSVIGLWDTVALGASQRTTEASAGQVNAVRAYADRARRLVSERVLGRRRLIVMTVTGATARGARLHDAVHVQSRGDQLAGRIDHVTVAGFATSRLRVGRRWRQAMAAAAGLFARSRLGPDGAALLAVAPAAAAGPSLGVVARRAPTGSR